MTRFIECDICGKDCQDRYYTPLFRFSDDDLSLFPSLVEIQDICTECMKELDMQILNMVETKEKQQLEEEEDMR